MTNNSQLPTVPEPAHTCRLNHASKLEAGEVVTAQPKAMGQMLFEDAEVMRLRGGCGCLIGGVHIETG